MNLKKVSFAIIAPMIIILAATLVPTVNSNETDIEEYIVNTVEVKDQFQIYLDSLNDKAKDKTTFNEEDCSYSLNTSIYEIYGKQKFDDAPLIMTLKENGVTSNYGNIDFNSNNNASDKGSIVSTDGTDYTDYAVVYDNNGDLYDIILTIDGRDFSAREQYSPVDDCFALTATAVTVASIARIMLFFTCIMLITWSVQYMYEHVAFTDEGTVYFDEEIKITDDISVGVTKGDFLAVSICGQDYKVCEKYQEKNKDKNGFLFVLLTYKGAFIFPKDIGENNAKKIMNLGNDINKHGKYSVFTKSPVDAERIASVRGTPYIEIDGNNDSGLKMYHYHTYLHQTPAHAFYVKE